MEDVERLPVRPNIHATPLKQEKKKQKGIFDDSKDPDIQKYINKPKVDILELKTNPTKEEEDAKKENESNNTWILVALIVVVVVLIIIIVYFVLKNHKTSDPVPHHIVKHAPPPVYAAPPVVSKPADYVEATEKELDSVLENIDLNTIPEEPAEFNTPRVEEVEEKPEDIDEVEVEVNDELRTLILDEDFDNDDSNYIDADDIEFFHKQVMDSSE